MFVCIALLTRCWPATYKVQNRMLRLLPYVLSGIMCGRRRCLYVFVFDFEVEFVVVDVCVTLITFNTACGQVLEKLGTKEIVAKTSMADDMDASFSLERMEIEEIDAIASVPNLDRVTTCSCQGLCLRAQGRKFCPCKSIGQYCTSNCHAEHVGECLNTKRVHESESDTDSTVG